MHLWPGAQWDWGAELCIAARSRRARPSKSYAIALALALTGAFATGPFASAQTPPADGRNQEQLLALIKEVKDQQAALGENQAKIEEKLAALTEAIRQARIYSSRAGR